MNAQEAVELSKENTYKLADQLYKKVLQELHQEIRSNASNGLYEARVTVLLNNVWIRHDIGQLIKISFEQLGFGVEIVQRINGTSQVIRCYWSDK